MHARQRGLNSECPRTGRYRRPRAASTLLCFGAVGKAARNRGAPSMIWKDLQTLKLEAGRKGMGVLGSGNTTDKGQG